MQCGVFRLVDDDDVVVCVTYLLLREQSDSEVATLVKNPEVGMAPLLDKIVEFLPPPETKSYPDDLTPDQLAAAKAADFSMLVSMIGHDT